MTLAIQSELLPVSVFFSVIVNVLNEIKQSYSAFSALKRHVILKSSWKINNVVDDWSGTAVYVCLSVDVLIRNSFNY